MDDYLLDGKHPNSNVHKGKFLWCEDKSEKKRYINSIQEKIGQGYYYSENVISRVVEELAPSFNENLGGI